MRPEAKYGEIPGQRQRSCIICYLLAVAFCMPVLSGCDQTFQPLQKNNLYNFTIYGYLDASTDTQWIRVAPARQEFNMPPVVPEIRVTLEDLQIGNTVVMNDSLVVSGSGFNYLNYWTTMDIEHGQTYRLRAERPDGSSSAVLVTVPDEFPTPILRLGIGRGGRDLYIDGDIEHIADVQTKWYVRLKAPGFEERRVFSFPYRNEIERIPLYGGTYRVIIYPFHEEQQLMDLTNLPLDGEIELLKRQIYIATAGPEWNEEIPLMDDPLYALLNGFSNVINGLGYVVGIASKTIPYRSCFDEEFVYIPCPEEESYW